MFKLFNSKKAFQMSINMIVVLVLGMVILGVGISIFTNAYSKVTDLRENVDSQTAARINSLLDDGSLLIIPFSSKDGKRGDFVDFDLGINNELGDTYEFSILVTYAGSSAFSDGEVSDPFQPVTIQDIGLGNLCKVPETCGTNWAMVAGPKRVIKNNDRSMVPIRIVIPKKNVLKGQYIFNVDVCYAKSGEDPSCKVDAGVISNRYSSRQKIYIKI